MLVSVLSLVELGYGDGAVRDVRIAAELFANLLLPLFVRVGAIGDEGLAVSEVLKWTNEGGVELALALELLNVSGELDFIKSGLDFYIVVFDGDDTGNGLAGFALVSPLLIDDFSQVEEVALHVVAIVAGEDDSVVARKVGSFSGEEVEDHLDVGLAVVAGDGERFDVEGAVAAIILEEVLDVLEVGGFVEADPDCPILDLLKPSIAVAVVHDQIENHRGHPADFHDMLDDIELDAEDFEILVEEYDPVSEIVEPLNLLHVFVERTDEAIELLELLGYIAVLGAEEEGEIRVGVIGQDFYVLGQPVVVAELSPVDVDVLHACGDVGGGLVLLSGEEGVALYEFAHL